MIMSPPNIRRPLPDNYDPKQRFIGGIVLFLMVMLIYSILKLVLGFSSTPTGKFGLSAPLGDEVTNHAPENNPSPTTSSRTSAPLLFLPQSFVFLDINGKPLQKETLQQITGSNSEGKGWYVQVASFKEKKRAEQLVEQIKEKRVFPQPTIAEGEKGLYKVILPVQLDRDSAEQQKKQLRNSLRVKAVVKKVDE